MYLHEGYHMLRDCTFVYVSEPPHAYIGPSDNRATYLCTSNQILTFINRSTSHIIKHQSHINIINILQDFIKVQIIIKRDTLKKIQ